MASNTAVVAILVSNPALRALLAATLASSPTLRIRPFESEVALTTYMRLAPVDIVVADFDGTPPADALGRVLRADTRIERRDFQMIALSSRIDSAIKAASLQAGIDEIIVKPMSPRYLLERVLSRLARRPAATLRRTRPVTWPANVIPLFGQQPQQTLT